jgi:hypothetical protein
MRGLSKVPHAQQSLLLPSAARRRSWVHIPTLSFKSACRPPPTSTQRTGQPGATHSSGALESCPQQGGSTEALQAPPPRPHAPMPPAPAPSQQVVLPPAASLAARHHPVCIRAPAAWATIGPPWCAAALPVALQAGHHWQPRTDVAPLSECDPLPALDSAVRRIDVPQTRAMAHGSTPCATTYRPWSQRAAATRRMRTVSPCRRPLFPLLAESREVPPLCSTSWLQSRGAAALELRPGTNTMASTWMGALPRTPCPDGNVRRRGNVH